MLMNLCLLLMDCLEERNETPMGTENFKLFLILFQELHSVLPCVSTVMLKFFPVFKSTELIPVLQTLAQRDPVVI